MTLKWLKGLTTALEIIDALLKALTINDDINRAMYYMMIYAQLGGALQIEERLASLQACNAEASLYDQALADAISDEADAFTLCKDPNNILGLIVNLPPEAKQHLYNVVKTGVQMDADTAFGIGIAAVLGKITTIPALALAAIDAYLLGELVNAVFDVAEDSQRLMQGNAYLSLDSFLKDRMDALLPSTAAGYPTVSGDNLTRLGSMSSLGTYSARQAIACYKAAIEDAGLIGDFIQWLVRGFNDGSTYLQALDDQMAFYLDMHYLGRRHALWDNAMSLINIEDASYYGWHIPDWIYAGSLAYSPPVATVSTNVAINIISSPSNAGTTTGAGTVGCRASVTVTATAKPGYTFAEWSESGSVVSTSQSYTFTATATCNLVAKFSVIPYSISTSSSPSGGGTTSGGGTKTYGDPVSVTATPTSCYTFMNWTDGGTVVSTSRTYSFIAVASHNLTANFAVVSYTVTTAASPPSAGSTSGGGTKTCGSSATVTATPNPAYGFLNWTESGAVVSISPAYTFTVSTNRNLVANFNESACTYTLAPASTNLTAGAQGATFAVSAGTGCPWTAATTNTWLHNTSTGTGSGTVNFTADANTNASPRDGTIVVQGQLFTVTQAGVNSPQSLTLTWLGPQAHEGYDSGPWGFTGNVSQFLDLGDRFQVNVDWSVYDPYGGAVVVACFGVDGQKLAGTDFYSGNPGGKPGDSGTTTVTVSKSLLAPGRRLILFFDWYYDTSKYSAYYQSDFGGPSNRMLPLALFRDPASPEAFDVPFVSISPAVDGTLNWSEWANASATSIAMRHNDGTTAHAATLLAMHDGTWLHLGINSGFYNAPHLYWVCSFDGNHSHAYDGNATEPHIDVSMGYPAPGRPGYYDRYDASLASGSISVTPPAGTGKASAAANPVVFEFKLKLSELGAFPGSLVGFYFQHGNDGSDGYGYPQIDNPIAQWPHLRILPLQMPLSIYAHGNYVVLTWSSGTLYSADDLSGPWVPVAGASSPWTNTASADKRFYRQAQ